MNLERAINVMGWKMLGHSVQIPHEEQEKAARLIQAKLAAADNLAATMSRLDLRDTGSFSELQQMHLKARLAAKEYRLVGTEEAKG